jgi:hypothetical protein
MPREVGRPTLVSAALLLKDYARSPHNSTSLREVYHGVRDALGRSGSDCRTLNPIIKPFLIVSVAFGDHVIEERRSHWSVCRL